jgi:hypothetical protein
MRQQRGELLFSEIQLRDWRMLLEQRVDWLGLRGVTYHFLVPPNPHSVYPDKLPRPVAAGTPRPVTQLIRYLKDVQSDAPLLYPLDQLIERRDEPIYVKTGTHWTELGAFIAYEPLMDSIGESKQVRRLVENEIAFRQAVGPGGLGRKLEPPEVSTHVFGTPRDTAAKLTLDNRVYLRGLRMEYECPAAGNSVGLVFGDSFAHTMLHFLAESFGRTVFAHLPTLDRELVAEVRPDVVVSILNERFLIRVPVDEGAKTLEEWADEKRACGAIYPPRTRSGNRVDTPPPWKGGGGRAES